MWEQSLLIRSFLTVLVAGGGSPGFAMSYCSDSFRFDQLCPDPRFGTREPGAGGGGGMYHPPTTDTNINLNTVSVDPNYYYQSPANNYGGRSHTASMNVKDPSTTSCDFHRNGVETAVVNAVHVSEKPFNFRNANPCSHIVKFTYDLFNSGGTGGVGVVGGHGGNPPAKQSVCKNAISIRRPGSQDVNHRKDKHETEEQQPPRRRQPDHDEETAKKMNVYFWHNFTIFPHNAEFVDTITNHHWSKEEISCAKETRSRQYVQIVVIVSKSGRCEVILQEYKLDEKRSPYGCSDTFKKDPIQRQFCGSYECSQSTGILTSLKLQSKQGSELGENSSWNSPVGGGGGGSKSAVEREGGGSPHHQQKNYPSGFSSSHQHENGEGTHTYPHFEEGSMRSTGAPPCTEITDSTTTPTTTPGVLGPHTQQHHPESEEEEEEKPTDWMEKLFLFAFPTGGVIFIIVVLSILRTQSAREICRGYTYPRPRQYHNQGIPIGSFTSIDKNGLPI